MKKIINIVLISTIAIAIAGLSGYIYLQYQNKKIKRININIFRANTQKGFLNKKALLKTINKDSLISKKPLKEINTEALQKQLNDNPYIAKSDAYLDINGELIINVKEKIPIVKVYTLKNQVFYIDKNGKLFPDKKNYAPHIPIANGYIDGISYKTNRTVYDEMYKTSVLPAIYHLSKKIVTDKFLKAFVSQIYINSKKQIDLIPEIGNQINRFGDIKNTNIKLENLKAFYKQAFINQNGNKYSQINLEYINQIVCTKK